jgi:hypothetical protein
MGATSWHYYTPYRADPEEALQRLRADVFSRGDYVDVTGSLGSALRATARRFGHDPDAPDVRTAMGHNLRLQRAIETGDVRGLTRGDQALVRRVRALQSLGEEPPHGRGRRPRSIAELLERAGECGTHSIIDIEHIAPRPRFAAAAPLTSASVRRLFGTAEPTHAEVEARWEDAAERLGRWQARYLAVYRDGRPHEYAFIGCSGD